jgi:hypothetical protein
VQPGKISGRIRHFRGCLVRVALGAGRTSASVGKSWTIRISRETSKGGVQKVATAKHGQNCSICTSSLQVPLPAEQNGFMPPAGQRATTIEDVFIHIQGKEEAGG